MFLKHEALDPRALWLRVILRQVLFVGERPEQSEERGMKDKNQRFHGYLFTLVVLAHGAAVCHCTRLLYHSPPRFGDLGVVNVQVSQFKVGLAIAIQETSFFFGQAQDEPLAGQVVDVRLCKTEGRVQLDQVAGREVGGLRCKVSVALEPFVVEFDGLAPIVIYLVLVFLSELVAFRVVVAQEVRERLENPVSEVLVALARKVELVVVEVFVDNASILFALEGHRWQVRCQHIGKL